MAERIIRLGPGECSDVETGARYLAALAFPAAHEDRDRQDAAAAWVGEYLRGANRTAGTAAPFEDERLSKFARLPPKWCRAKLRTTRRRLRDRFELARAARPWMREVSGDPHPRVPGISKFSQRQISLYLCRGDLERAANFQKRIWRPGRPVFHLAIAQDRLLCAYLGEITTLPFDLAAPKLIGKIVEVSQLVEALIRDDDRFAVRDVLKLEWVA